MSEERAGLSGQFPESDRETLGDRLRAAREYVGMKQEEVARYLGIPRTALSNIEGGQRKVDALELARLAKLYQRPASWFTEQGTATDSEWPAEVAHVARAAAALSSQDQQELARFADFLKSRAKSKESGDGR
jgi:transcriptional regulator with XRE-family HTH domain